MWISSLKVDLTRDALVLVFFVQGQAGQYVQPSSSILMRMNGARGLDFASHGLDQSEPCIVIMEPLTISSTNVERFNWYC